MNQPDTELSIVIPVRDGAEQLPSTFREIAAYLARTSRPTEVILVDDGSAQPAARLLAEFTAATPHVTLLRNDVNRGKGRAVVRGMLAASGRHRIFTDADLAYPLTEIGTVTAALDAGHDIAIACRVLPESRYVMSPTFFSYLYTRHVLSRLYNAVVRWTTLPGILDTQAGLKGFTARAADIVFPRLTIPGFGFDVEALYVARRHGLTTRQVAVSFRYDSEPSAVRLMQDSTTMLTDLIRLRWNSLRGRYR